MSLLQYKINSNNLLRIYIPAVFISYIFFDLLSTKETLADYYFFEVAALLMASFLVLPSIFSMPKKYLSKDYKTFAKFMEKSYSHFVVYMTFVFTVPFVIYLFVQLALALIHFSQSVYFEYSIPYQAIMPFFLFSAHILKASALVKATKKIKIIYLLGTILFAYLLYLQSESTSLIRYIYYFIVAFI